MGILCSKNYEYYSEFSEEQKLLLIEALGNEEILTYFYDNSSHLYEIDFVKIRNNRAKFCFTLVLKYQDIININKQIGKSYSLYCNYDTPIKLIVKFSNSKNSVTQTNSTNFDTKCVQ